jgi:hypothetical protein
MKGKYSRILMRPLTLPLVLCLVVIGLSRGSPLESSPLASPSGPGGRFPNEPPAWDSGWVEPFGSPMHNLGGDRDDYVVDVMFRDNGSGHHRGFGSDEVDNGRPWVGAFWSNLNTIRIDVDKALDDEYVDEVRIRIWVVPESDYDSGWVNMEDDRTQTLDHNLGGDTDDYLVYMVGKGIGYGVHQYGYGMDYRPPASSGAYCYEGFGWRNLTTTSITVSRGACDLYADWIRVRIWLAPPPQHVIGWTALSKEFLIVRSHPWGGPDHDLFLDFSFKNPSDWGVHQMYYGLDSYRHVDDTIRYQGATWTGFTDGSITLVRGGHDWRAEQGRLRIWTTNATSVPVVLRNH